MRVFRLKNKPHDGRLVWQWLDTPLLGRVLAAVTQDHLCWLGFSDLGEDFAFSAFQKQWGDVSMEHKSHPLMNQIIGAPRTPLPLWLRGTAFQHQVWAELLNIPQTETRTYGFLAQEIGKPNAARAVGNAVGANPVSWYVPCHRVVHRASSQSGFMWGKACKKRLLELDCKEQEKTTPL